MTSYEVITQEIIKKMEQGVIPWVKPWHVDSYKCTGMLNLFPAYSFSNGKRYNFINQMLLGFQAGEFATFPQIKKAGGKVKRGEKAQIIAGWIVEDRPSGLVDDEGNDILRKCFSLRYYKVFNILTQCEGVEPKHDWTKDEMPEVNHNPQEKAEQIINNYLSSEDAPHFQIIHGNDRAYYSPIEDLVVVPDMNQFDLVEGYYGTVFHELTHSTLKESRCNRSHEGTAARGGKEYSREELVAEMGSCFLCSHAGLDSEKCFDNSVAYLQGWLTALKNDPRMIIQASAQAEKAAEYILNA